ncbi:MAG: amino acid adenylation domain-containing protein [Gemmatimonadota bacterium]
MTLHERFAATAREHGSRVAIIDPSCKCSISYGDLERLADAITSDLADAGAGHGRRVGVYAPKSIPTIAAILGALRAEAAYVPVDVTAPPARSTAILADCSVNAIVADRNLVDAIRGAWRSDLRIREFSAASQLARLGCDVVLLTCEDSSASPIEELAYVLYTSGSTGKPKGVTHTHASAQCFVDWCSETFEPSPGDRFSSHAPLHFDLSILDLYVPLSHGASVVLMGESEGKNPLLLAPLIAENGISVWYSTPSTLRLLIEHGALERHDATRLRLVLFAGEVFAPSHLRRLQAVWPGRRYFNLYGPTETNVCSAFEVIGEVPPDRVDPYPIGKPITGDDTIVVDSDGRIVSAGEEGELLVHGGTVMAGYWKRPDLDARAFHVDPESRRWYRTGDIVRENRDGDYEFLGRRDRMIKRRGYRVELGEIEAALYRHSSVSEAAVVAVPSEDDGLRVHAFVSWGDVQSPSTITLKRFCADNLPLYMVPDRFTFLEKLPKTSTDKIDYVRLRDMRH